MSRWEMAHLRKLFGFKWRPLEGPMSFNKRTSLSIQKWFVDHKVLPLHCRILKVVFKAAWRERTCGNTTPISTLESARLFRCRLWWEAFRSNPGSTYRKRKAEGLTRQTSGHRVEWEDVFVDTLGLLWRELRDNCGTESRWMLQFPDFCKRTCCRWMLFFPSFLDKNEETEVPDENKLKKQRVCSHRLQDLPEEHGDDAPPVQ